MYKLTQKENSYIERKFIHDCNLDKFLDLISDRYNDQVWGSINEE